MEENGESFLSSPLMAINVGVQDFADNLAAQDVEVLNVDWSPPAGGDAEMLAILDTLL